MFFIINVLFVENKQRMVINMEKLEKGDLLVIKKGYSFVEDYGLESGDIIVFDGYGDCFYRGKELEKGSYCRTLCPGKMRYRLDGKRKLHTHCMIGGRYDTAAYEKFVPESIKKVKKSK